MEIGNKKIKINSTLTFNPCSKVSEVHALFYCFSDVKRVLFVPYALHDRDEYAKIARNKFQSLGIFQKRKIFFFLPLQLLLYAFSCSSSVWPAGYEVDSIHEAADPVEAVRKAEAIFIGGGAIQTVEVEGVRGSNWKFPSCYHCVSLLCVAGGGNTFRLLKCLYDNKLVTEIRKRVLEVGKRFHYILTALTDQGFSPTDPQWCWHTAASMNTFKIVFYFLT